MATIPVVFSFNDDYAVPACVAIKSLVDNKAAGTRYEIVVLYTSISEANRALISSIDHIKWVKMDESTLGSMAEVPITQEYPIEVYYRLAIAELFPQWDKIIYSDVDVLFHRDLTDLYKTDLEGYHWAGVPIERNEEPSWEIDPDDPDTLSGHAKFAENKNRYIFASGLMVINAKKMREDHMLKKFLGVAREFSGRLRMFDLDILNIACQGTIKELPLDYCVFESLSEKGGKSPFYPFLSRIFSQWDIWKAVSHPYISHYTGCERVRVWKRPKKPYSYTKYFCMFF